MSAASNAPRNPGTPYSVELLHDKLVDAAGNNAADLYCPLGACRCLLLRKGSAKLVRRNGDALDHPSAKPTQSQNDGFPLAASSSSSGSAAGDEETRDCWLVTSPLAFENIGFTKGVLSNTVGESSGKAVASLPEGASIRYLACADCDCGPLGWHVEHKGSDLGRDVDREISTGASGPMREFLIAVERCRYKLA